MTSLEQPVFSRLHKHTPIHVVGVTGVEGATVASFLLQEGFTNIVGHALCAPEGFEREVLRQHQLTDPKKKQTLLQDVRAWKFPIQFQDTYLQGIEGAEIIFAPQSWELYGEENAPLYALRDRLANIMQLYLELAPCPTIGVTGSDGKTTTTHLITHLLRSAGRRAWLSGNYREGEHLLSRVRSFDPSDVLVLEVSNRHLNFGLTVHPTIGVVTNVTQNHLNEYDGFDAYRQVKERLLGENTTAVLNADNPFTFHMGDHCVERRLFSRLRSDVNGAFFCGDAFCDGDGTICAREDFRLKGDHNVENALAAITVARVLGLSSEEISQGLKTFGAVPERLELLMEIDGRQVVNDLSATSAESARRGVLAFSGRPLSIVVGGETKGVDYAPLAQTLKEEGVQVFAVKSDVAEALLAEGVSVTVCQDAREAIWRAYENTPREGVLLVSPAGAYFSSRFLPGGLEPIISSLRSSVLREDQRT